MGGRGAAPPPPPPPPELQGVGGGGGGGGGPPAASEDMPSIEELKPVTNESGGEISMSIDETNRCLLHRPRPLLPEPPPSPLPPSGPPPWCPPNTYARQQSGLFIRGRTDARDSLLLSLDSPLQDPRVPRSEAPPREQQGHGRKEGGGGGTSGSLVFAVSSRVLCWCSRGSMGGLGFCASCLLTLGRAPLLLCPRQDKVEREQAAAKAEDLAARVAE